HGPAAIVGPGMIWAVMPTPSSRKSCVPFRYSAKPSVLYGDAELSWRFSTIVRRPATPACSRTQASIAKSLVPRFSPTWFAYGTFAKSSSDGKQIAFFTSPLVVNPAPPASCATLRGGVMWVTSLAVVEPTFSLNGHHATMPSGGVTHGFCAGP